MLAARPQGRNIAGEDVFATVQTDVSRRLEFEPFIDRLIERAAHESLMQRPKMGDQERPQDDDQQR